MSSNTMWLPACVSVCPSLSSSSSWHAGAAFPTGHQSSTVSRDPNSVKAQINGILHEDSLPFYDQVAAPSAPSRQGSAPLPQVSGHSLQSHTTSPRLRMPQRGTAPTRLSTQGSQDLGDLGVSSPSGQMSRANSRDTGHIATLAPMQHASGSWQGRLSRISADSQQPQSARQHAQTHLAAAQRTSASQGSAYASIESMLSSIPETLSGMPSMPSMPSVPSMSEIEKSMQSGWSSFTGSLGLSPAAAPAPAQPHQQPPAPAAWLAFADVASTQPASSFPAESAAEAMPAASQPAQPLSTAASQQNGVVFPHSSLGVRAADGDGGSSGGHTLLGSPRKKLTGLQAIDPLTAVKEAASVPLRAMSSVRQDSSSETSSHSMKPALLATQASINRSSPATHVSEGASIPTVAASLSSDWSGFDAPQAADLASMQPLPREVTQPSNTIRPQSTRDRANADVWAQWSTPANVQGQLNDTPRDTSHVTTAPLSAALAADHHSLLDM